MGVRMDHLMGLNEWAKKFVEGEPVLICTELVIRLYPDNKQETLPLRHIYESSVRKEKSGEFYSGMFGNEYPLYKYTFPDGRIYLERVQTAPWSSGPVFFLALQDEQGEWVKESLWTEEAIKGTVA